MSLSFKREKEAKTRPDHANPLAKKSKAKVKGAVVKVTSPKETSPRFFRGKLPGKQQLHEEPKTPGIIGQYSDNKYYLMNYYLSYGLQ